MYPPGYRPNGFEVSGALAARLLHRPWFFMVTTRGNASVTVSYNAWFAIHFNHTQNGLTSRATATTDLYLLFIRPG